MDAFEDKQQEIKQLVNYIKLITESSDPQWEVFSGTFSVTIQGIFNRTFSKAELESFEHQIKYLQTLDNSTDIPLISKNKTFFKYFLKIIDNIRNRCKVSSQEFLYIHNPTFKENQYQYVKKMKDGPLTKEECEKFLFPLSGENSVRDEFNLGPKDYYEIGKIVIKKDLDNETLNTVFNNFGFINVDKIMMRNFINNTLADMKSIDPIKIGRKFVEELSKEEFKNVDYSKFDLDERLKKKSFVKLTKFVDQFSEDQTLLIANVPKPGHVYHLIQPSYICWPDKLTKNYQCPPENILFCTENNSFQDALNKILNTNNGFLYFIVHPENLRSDEMQRLKTFISSRRSQNVKIKDDMDEIKTIEGAKSTPKVMIITSLPASFFDIEENILFSFNDSLSFDEKDIQEFAIFNAQWRRMVCNNHNDIFLFSSSKTGIGKTYRIKRILNKAINIFENMEEEEDLKFYQKDKECHIYFDITTNEIPDIIKENTFVHISISPELFLNNFQIFDQLYILIQYGFFIFQNGNHISYSTGRNIIPTFLIEIPNLDDENMLKNFYDFPIAPSNNHQKYKWESEIAGRNNDIYDIITEEFDEIGVKENFKNGLFHLTTNSNQIPIDDKNVKFLMNLIFTNCKDIKTYKNLIIKSKKFFFKDKVSDDDHIDDNRIISKVKQMIEDYSKLIVNQYKDNDKMKKYLFLLTIRTALYVWHFIPSTTRSIILLVPQLLMTIKAFDEENGWIFVGFYSKRDDIYTWNEGKNKIEKIKSDLDLIKKFREKFQNDNRIHILSDNPNTKNDDMSLQTQFFKTILLFLPKLNLEKSSKNPLNIALILLSLFSNMDHFPKDSFKDIIDDLKNDQLDIPKLKNRFKNDKGFKYNVEWTEMDELLTYYLRSNKNRIRDISSINDLILQLKSELRNYENIWNSIKISFSKTYFARFIEIILKVYYRNFSILQGETGCGKTSVIRLLNDIISLIRKDENTKFDINWSLSMIDFHGNYLQNDFIRDMNYYLDFYSMKARELEESKNTRIILFLDEVNTSPAYYNVIDHIQNSSSQYLTYIGAINAHVEVNNVTRKLSLVGIPQKINKQLSNIKLFSHPDENIKEITEDYDANKFAYNVKEDQESVKSAIINADPQEFDEDDRNFAAYFPDEEKNAIRSIITKVLLQWGNNTKIDLQSTINLSVELISLIFKSVRSFMQTRAIFSYRDVHRYITIFTYIFDYFCKKKLESKLLNDLRNNKASDKKIQEEKKLYCKKITSASIIIAFYVSLICRFSHEEIEVDEEIAERFDNHPFKDNLGKIPEKICMYKLILNYVSCESNWPTNELPYIKNWESISILFAYAKCMKYVINDSVYPLPSLMLHLLILSLTVSASSRDKKSNSNNSSLSNSEFFTCLIIGMPGTSKSKAVELFKRYHLEASQEEDAKHEYFITTYLCSRTSDSDSLLAQFLNGAWFLKTDQSTESIKNKKAIVILEEVGLANYNPSRPLKILHPLCDKGVKIKDNDYCKVIPIQLSNYQIDFANMNRGFLVCAGLPTDNEYSSSIAFGRFLKMRMTINRKKKYIQKYFTGKEFSKNILYKITQLTEETVFEYDKIIDIIIDEVYDKIPQNDEFKELFISKKKIFIESKQFYSDVLKTLWNVTQDSHQRPSFYPMRPLFKLISNVSELKKSNDDEESVFLDLTLILNSFVNGKNTLKSINNEPLLNQFLNQLNSLNDQQYFDLNNFDQYHENPVTLYNSFINDNSEFCRKALLIRTENYEAYRYINLLEKENDADIDFTFNFIPLQFQDVGQNCQHKFDYLFKKIFASNRMKNKLRKKAKNPKPHIFYHIGNDPFSDYIIDILNFINHADQCPTAILKGFPVYLPNFPENIKFVFIINENEIYNNNLRNPVPYPLIDRLDHLFLNKQILKYYHKDLLKDTSFDKIKTKYLLDLPLTEKEQKKVAKNKNLSKKNYYLNYDISDFDYLIDALKDKKNGIEILKNHFKNTFMQNFNDLLSIMKDESNGGLPFYSAIVFTRTPIYESFIFDGIENFEIINDSQVNLDEILEDIDSEKSIIIHSDIFNIPDDNTINNALSIINSIQKIIMESSSKRHYIIIFHVNENRIPEGFGNTCYFPVVWIQSLTDLSKGSSLIQEICKAIFNGSLTSNSPLLNKIYTKMSNDIKDQLEDDKNQKVNAIFSAKGAKLRGNNQVLSIGKIIGSVLKLVSKDNSDDDSGKKVSFKDMQKMILNIIEEIDNNLEEEKDEKEKEEKNKILNEELYSFNLESRFLSTVSQLVDAKIISLLAIAIKYCATINLSKTNLENIESFIEKAHECVFRFSKIIDEISLDTFSSPVKTKEINNKYPELLFYNILRPYFEVNIYYNSLNKMELMINNIPFNKIPLIDIFSYINDNYYGVKPYLPYNANYGSTTITIDAFNYFLDSRGLFTKKEKGIQDIIDFINQRDDDICPNLFDIEYPVNNIRSNIHSENWKDVEYKQILLSDCNKKFIDKCNANDNPHPCIVYSHFINVDGFSFNDYNNNDPDGKIYQNQLIPWTFNFFLYGSFNNFKKNGNFLNNIINFISLGLKDNTFLTRMSTSTEFKHFLFDYLFTEFCKKDNNEKIDTFDYLKHLDSDALFQKFMNDHADSKDKFKVNLRDTKISNILSNKPVITLPKRVIDSPDYDPNTYDPSDFDPFTDESINIIKSNFKEINEIEETIANYDSWKTKLLNELGERSILENIRLKLFKYKTEDTDCNELDISDCFGTWLLNPNISLLVRQVYEICKAIKNDQNDRVKAEFMILQRIINPWNDDDKSTKFFWEWFVTNVNGKSFNTNITLSNLLKNNPIKDILNNCLPYYVCKYEVNSEKVQAPDPDSDKEEEESPKISKFCFISKRNEIKTYFIERLLYSNTILLINDNTDKGFINQLFSFMTHLPFAEKTKDLYILAAFINEILSEFRKQINLLFLIIYSCQNCQDLLNISYFKKLIDDPKRTESRESLKQAFISADKYNKGNNAAEKLKSYINRLIEINNKTILLPEKKKLENLKFRLVSKASIHSNISLMNTFVPALAHLNFDTSININKMLPNAIKVLVKNKDCKSLINPSPFFAAIPSVFDFSEGSYALKVMKNIEKIKESDDIFRFPLNGMVNSLCKEIITFKSDKTNINSYRLKIWSKIKKTPIPPEKPDYSNILDTLIPLFEEYDETISSEHIFFSWDNNCIPETLDGIEAAAHFLNSYKVNEKSLYDIIESGSI